MQTLDVGWRVEMAVDTSNSTTLEAETGGLLQINATLGFKVIRRPGPCLKEKKKGVGQTTNTRKRASEERVTGSLHDHT